jgi:hypothetical protein
MENTIQAEIFMRATVHAAPVDRRARVSEV